MQERRKEEEEKLEMERKALRRKLKDRKEKVADTLCKTLHTGPKHINMICVSTTSVTKKYLSKESFKQYQTEG